MKPPFPLYYQNPPFPLYYGRTGFTDNLENFESGPRPTVSPLLDPGSYRPHSRIMKFDPKTHNLTVYNANGSTVRTTSY
eukprot:SAG11_NODE_1229_length_5462_cov_12.053888_6_plen_79_part_00